jgi:signal transduction histidine kinase
METIQKQKKKTRAQLLDEAIPHFEHFIESRESYIKALETALNAIKHENRQFSENNLAIRSSIDELVSMQRLSNIISTATDPGHIFGMLIELTKQVVPVQDANIFLLDEATNKLLPLSAQGSTRLLAEAQQQLESGIVDWVFSEKKTVIIPDLEGLIAQSNVMNFVIVPLILRNKGTGIYLIHTEKPHEEFSNQDIQLLTVLANQAAVGVENSRSYKQLAKVNEELKASQAQIMQAAKLAAIGELAASVVHEIKNPVQILILHVAMAEKGNAHPDWINVLSIQVKRLAEICKRLMDFSRNVSDEVPMSIVNVNKAVEEMVAIVHHEFRNDNIDIELSLSENLPSITGNSTYLQQVFLNLLINARDAMPQGGKVSVQTELKGMIVQVKFSDTGTGIKKEHLDRIFHPFFTTKEEGKGTGLGLSICSKLVAQHQGEMKVDSTEGAGTTFTIHLPVRRLPQ